MTYQPPWSRTATPQQRERTVCCTAARTAHPVQAARCACPAPRAAGFDHQNVIGGQHRGEPVRDHERRAPLHQLLERRLHIGLGFRVQVRRRLIEDEDARALQDRAGNRDPLALAAGEPVPALSDHRVVPFGKRHDKSWM